MGKKQFCTQHPERESIAYSSNVNTALQSNSKEVFMQTMSDQAVSAPPIEQAAGVPPLLNFPIARLQIVQASEVLKADWLDRSMLEPKLEQNADDLWTLTVHRQGEHSKFEVPYIGS